MYRKIWRFVGKIVHRQCCRLYSKITSARPLIGKDKGLIVGKMVEISFGAYDDEEATDSHGPPNCTYLPTYCTAAYLGVSSVILETESVSKYFRQSERRRSKTDDGIS